VGAYADWVDARVAIVHEWRGHGMSVANIARRLTPDADFVRALLKTPPLPVPGSSRALVLELRQRVADLEHALLVAEPHAPPTPRREPPRESDVRELAPHPREDT
jgi:hypothetical protein